MFEHATHLLNLAVHESCILLHFQRVQLAVDVVRRFSVPLHFWENCLSLVLGANSDIIDLIVRILGRLLRHRAFRMLSVYKIQKAEFG